MMWTGISKEVPLSAVTGSPIIRTATQYQVRCEVFGFTIVCDEEFVCKAGSDYVLRRFNNVNISIRQNTTADTVI